MTSHTAMKIKVLVALICLVLNLTWNSSDAKVVVFFPVPGTSHIRYHTNIARAMANRGHEAWVCIPDFYIKSGKVDISGINVLSYGETFGDIEGEIASKTKIHESFFENKTQSPLTVMFKISSYFDELAIAIIADGLPDKVQAIKPDLFVLDGLMFIQIIYVVPYKLDIPYAAIGSMHNVVNYRIPFSPATLPLQFGVANDEMDFWARLQNTVLYSLQIIKSMLIDPDPISRFAPEKPYKPLSEIIARAEVFIVELDPIMDYPRPMLPNTKLIGGTAIRDAKPLQDPFKSFVEGSKKGIILVSFGSTLLHFPSYIFNKINAACEESGMNVIWRSDEISPDPKRIMTKEWIPQNDLLGNGNTKLFISHCGKNGQYEALYYAVPVLCLPIFGDQLYNAERVKKKGYGLKADMRFTSREEFSEIITELLTNTTYKTNIAKASKLFRLLYKSPMKEAAFWLDHVMEFGGEYMRSSGQKMPYYQFLMLDVIFVLLVVISLILCLFGVLLYCIFSCIFCRSKKNKYKPE